MILTPGSSAYWIKRLKEVGFTEEQAEAEVSLVREALAVNLKDLATKADLERLKLEIDARFISLEAQMDSRFGQMEARFARLDESVSWLKWLSGAIAVGMLAQLLKSFGVL